MSESVQRVEGLIHLSDEDKESVEKAIHDAFSMGYKEGHKRGLVESLLNTELENDDA